ncbi:type II toxin-antitoxin system PemK/MazF family toxin [Microbacterium sp.]|uniref:type II toxin-antitoxin system PemK/MazF family toxin n=1 Tax=Microbacterium sp. TaxID=51671 RepID=UPI003A83DE18
MSTARRIMSLVVDLVAAATTRRDRPSTGSSAGARPRATLRPDDRDRSGSTSASTDDVQTVEVDPRTADGLRISYAPSRDGEPDAGEVIWTWVPYAENDGRGKDRPVLVIGRAGRDRVYAVRMTSKSHAGDRDFLPLGPGPWDSQGRPSWVDIDQLYSVHDEGMRREAAVLERERFARVAEALSARHGWAFDA